MRNHLRVTVALTAVLVVLPATAALAADPDAWVDVDPDDAGVDLGASDGTVTPVVDGGGGSTTECTWSRIPDDEIDYRWWTDEPVPGDLDEGGIADPDNPLSYVWYWKTCPTEDGGTTSTLIPIPREPEPDPVDPTELREEALDRLQLPTPTIDFNSPSDQVVHVESWLWIDSAIWQEHTKSVTAGGVTVTATAQPSRVVWDMGNGDVVVCEGPGTPYDTSRPAAEQSTECLYTYEHSSSGQPEEAYQVTATVEWQVSWTVTGAPGGGALPSLSTSSATSIRVAEMQALNQ